MTSTRGRSPRRRLAPEERKDELLDGAAELIMSEGVEALSVERVADTAGVSRGLVYNYFTNRDGLLRSLLERENQRIANEGLARVPRPAPFDVWTDAWLDLYFDMLESRGKLFLALVEEARVAGWRDSEPSMIRSWGETALATRLRMDFGIDRARSLLIARLLVGALVMAAIAVVRDGEDRHATQESCRLIVTATVRAL